VQEAQDFKSRWCVVASGIRDHNSTTDNAVLFVSWINQTAHLAQKT